MSDRTRTQFLAACSLWVLLAVAWGSEAMTEAPAWCERALARGVYSGYRPPVCTRTDEPIEYTGVIQEADGGEPYTFTMLLRPVEEPPIEPPVEPPIEPPIEPPEPPASIPGMRPAPGWLRDMPVGEWVALPSTNVMRDANASEAWGYPNQDAGPWVRGRYANILTAWCGASLSRMQGAAGAYVGGPCGGHGAHGGSELYEFDLATLTWSRTTEPYGTLEPYDNSWASWDGQYPDGSPIPAHVGDGVQVMEGGGRIWLAAVGISEYENGAPISGSMHQPMRAAMRDLTVPYEHTLTSSSWMWAPWTTQACAEMDLTACPRTEYHATAWDYTREQLWVVPTPSTAVPGRLMMLDPWADSGVDGRQGVWTDVREAPISGFNVMMVDHDRQRDLLMITNFGNSADATNVWTFDPTDPNGGYTLLHIEPGTGPARPYKSSGWEYSEATGCMTFYDFLESQRNVWALCPGEAEDSAEWIQIVGESGVVPTTSSWGVWSRWRIARYELDGELVELGLITPLVDGAVYAVRLPVTLPVGTEPPCSPCEDLSWAEKCAAAVHCYRFDSQASVDAVWDKTWWTGSGAYPARWDPVLNGGVLTTEPGTRDDTGGTFWINFPRLVGGQIWVQQRSWISAPPPNTSKSTLTYADYSCSGESLVQLWQPHRTGGVRPYWYEKCGHGGYEIQDPVTRDWDYQPGGDTACMRHVDHPTLPCWTMPSATWVTFTTHLDYDAVPPTTRVWVQADGDAERTQVIEYPIQSMTMVNTQQAGPYMNVDAPPDRPLLEVAFQDWLISREPL